MNEEIDNINDLGVIRDFIEKKFKEFGGNNSWGYAVGLSIEKSKELLKRGSLKTVKDPSEIVVENGRDGRCHEEAIEYWLNHCEEGAKIIDGYACSDGMWVKHGWCEDKDGKIHECTSSGRDMYFGYELKEKEVEEFFKFWTPERLQEFFSKERALEDEER